MGIQLQSGYLACDGATKNVSEYEDLAKFLGVDTKTETTFILPNLQGEFLRGAGNNSHTNQGNGGNARQHQDGTIFPHYNINSNNVAQIFGTDIARYATDFDYQYLTYKYHNIGTFSQLTFENILGGAYTSRPTNTSVLYCIKT